MKSLFEITSEYKTAIEELEAFCIENGTDEVPDEINERLFINKDELNAKLDAYFHVITELKGDLETISAYAKRIASKKKAIETNIARLNSYVGQAVELYGEKNKSGNHFVKCELFKVTASRSNRLVVLDASKLPNDLKKEVVTTTISIDNKTLKTRLNGGEKIPGAIINDSEINIMFK